MIVSNIKYTNILYYSNLFFSLVCYLLHCSPVSLQCTGLVRINCAKYSQISSTIVTLWASRDLSFREAAKKVIFFSGSASKRGGGGV